MSHVLTLNLTLSLTLNEGPEAAGRIIMASEGRELHPSTSPPDRMAAAANDQEAASRFSAHAESGYRRGVMRA